MREERLDRTLAVPVPDMLAPKTIARALEAVRAHLDMPIAYLSEFVGEEVVYHHVSAPGMEHLIKAGDVHPSEETYCRLVAAGKLPELIPDTHCHPAALALPATTNAPVRSHISLPIHRADGTIYGMFCCLSSEPSPDLTPRDLKTVKLFADLAAEQIRRGSEIEMLRDAARGRIAKLLTYRGFDIAYQPMYALADGRLIGMEALARFRSDPYRTPDKWFADAREAGLQIDLEIAAVEAAIEGLPEIPDGVRLSINAAPDTVATGRLLPIVRKAGAERITLEVTEHDPSGDFSKLAKAVSELRREGARLAIDDVGAGYAGLQQILRLRPDVLKLDMSLVRDIDTDPARRSLVAAMVHFAAETGAQLTGEGIETPGERLALRALGVTYGQGYLLGRPGPIGEARSSIPI